MSEKHTPGPWTVNGFGGDFRPVATVRGVVVSAVAIGDPISDARLIAAAPELLEASKAAAQFIANGVEMGFIRMPDPESGDSALMTRGLIVTAIAKAEGR